MSADHLRRAGWMYAHDAKSLEHVTLGCTQQTSLDWQLGVKANSRISNHVLEALERVEAQVVPQAVRHKLREITKRETGWKQNRGVLLCRKPGREWRHLWQERNIHGFKKSAFYSKNASYFGFNAPTG